MTSAVQTYAKVLPLSVDAEVKAEAQFQIANCQFKRGENSRAINDFELVSQRYPVTSYVVRSQYMIGRIHFSASRFAQARQIFDNIVENYPNDDYADDAQYAIGDCFYNEEKYDEAIQAYQQLINRFPRSEYLDDAVSGMQWSLLQQQKYDEALQLADTYIARFPDSEAAADLQFRKGELLYNLEKYDQAIAEYRKLYSNYRNRKAAGSAWFWIGNAYLKMADTTQAISAMQRQAREFPQADDSQEALLRAGELMAARSDFRGAEDVLQQVSVATSGVYAAQADIVAGNVYLKQSRFDAATQSFTHALAKSTDNSKKAAAELGLGRIAVAQIQYATAREHFNRAINLTGDETAAEAQFRFAQTYEAEQNYKTAAVEFLKVKYLYGSYLSWVVPGVYRAAMANEQQQLWGEARKLYQSILDGYKDEQYKQMAQERLQQLAGK